MRLGIELNIASIFEIVCNVTRNAKIHAQIRNGYEVFFCVIQTNAILKRFQTIRYTFPFQPSLNLFYLGFEKRKF